MILHWHIGYSLVLSIPQDLLEAEEGTEKGDLLAMSIVKHHAEVFLDRHKRNALHAAFLSPLKYLVQDVYEIFENLDSDFAKDLVGWGWVRCCDGVLHGNGAMNGRTIFSDRWEAKKKVSRAFLVVLLLWQKDMFNICCIL